MAALAPPLPAFRETGAEERRLRGLGDPLPPLPHLSSDLTGAFDQVISQTGKPSPAGGQSLCAHRSECSGQNPGEGVPSHCGLPSSLVRPSVPFSAPVLSFLSSPLQLSPPPLTLLCLLCPHPLPSAWPAPESVDAAARVPVLPSPSHRVSPRDAPLGGPGLRSLPPSAQQHRACPPQSTLLF